MLYLITVSLFYKESEKVFYSKLNCACSEDSEMSCYTSQATPENQRKNAENRYLDNEFTCIEINNEELLSALYV